MILKLTPILLLLFSVNALAEITPIQCPHHNVLYIPVDLGDKSVAAADIDKFGNRIIIYNPKVINNISKTLQDHIWAHECAHHELDHVLRRGYEDRQKAEDDADCLAIEILKWDKEKIEKLISEWNGVITSTHLENRIHNIRQCLDKNEKP